MPRGLLLRQWGPFSSLWGNPSFWRIWARLLIGGSVGVAFVSLLKLATHWFPPQRFAMTSGLALFFGLVGAVTAGAPLRFLVDQFGWRSVMFVSAVLTSALTIAIWVYIRDDPGEKGYKSFVSKSGSDNRSAAQIFSGLLNVLRYKNTWVISLTPSGIAGPLLAFSGLWGVSYLISRYGLTHAESAGITSLLLVTWGLGGPVLGGLSDRLHRRKALYLAGSIVTSLGWIIVIYLPQSAALGLYHHPGHCGICFGVHDYRLRLCERVRAPISGRNGFRGLQHGCDVGPHDSAAPDWMGAGSRTGPD